MKISKAIWITLLMIVLFTGCASQNHSESQNNQKNNLEIYTSLYPLQYVIEQIGGDSITVHSILPPGADAHTYEPSSKEIIKIAKGDLFFYLGAGMESYAETIAKSLDSQEVKLIEIGEDTSLFMKSESDHHHDDHGDHGDYDPHIWLDPIRLTQIAEVIKNELISSNPNEKDLYEENYYILVDKLTELDQSFQAVMDIKKNKHILVSHAAYGYWEDRYGIKQISVNGLSPSHEPSQKDLTNIIQQTKAYQLHYILFEKNTSNRVSEIIKDEIGAEIEFIHNLEVLTEEEIENNQDYLTLMQSNLEILDKVME